MWTLIPSTSTFHNQRGKDWMQITRFLKNLTSTISSNATSVAMPQNVHELSNCRRISHWMPKIKMAAMGQVSWLGERGRKWHLTWPRNRRGSVLLAECWQRAIPHRADTKAEPLGRGPYNEECRNRGWVKEEGQRQHLKMEGKDS